MAKEKAEKGNYAITLTTKGIIAWSALIFFVMGWMFVLGIMVGRGTAPVPINTHLLEKELAELKAAVLKKEHETIEAQTEGGEVVATELDFYEKLKEAPTREAPRHPIVQAQAPKPKPAAPAPTPEPVRPAPTPKPERAAVTPQPKADNPVAAPTPAKVEKPAAPPAGGNDRYTVQVASFKAQDGADQLVARLRTKGYQAYHVRVSVPDKGDWYRVRVGAFEGRSTAEAMLKKLGRDQVKGMVVSTQ